MIYKPLVVTGYEWINCCDARDYDVFRNFDGSSRKDTWVPIRVQRVRADENQRSMPSDFPWLGSHALVMRQRAVDALLSVIEPYCEILPLETSDGVVLHVLNVLRVLDALDEERADIVRFPGTRRIMDIRVEAFRDHVVQNTDIFKLPLRASPTYVSDRFVATVTRNALKGLEFHQVWPRTGSPT